MSREVLDLGGPGDDDPTAQMLRGVLQRQAETVQPSADGLARIQAEIARRHPSHSAAGRGHRFTPLLAAAAALVVVVAGGTAAVRVLHRQPDASEAGLITVTQSSASDVAATPASALPVYVAARQRDRVVLFREFRTVRGLAGPDEQVAEAVRLAIGQRPQDADYVQLFASTPTPTVRATVTDTTVSVDISPAPQPRSVPVSPEDARAAVDQLVWTATAAAATATQPGAGVPPPPTPRGGRAVHITLGGQAGQSLFGLVPLAPDLTRQTGPADPRAGVWIIDLADGSRRAPGTLDASGEAVAVVEPRVLVVLRRNGEIVHSADVQLGASEASDGTRPPRPGERGRWSISDWDATKPGTYTLEVYAPASLPAAAVQVPTPTTDGTAPIPVPTGTSSEAPTSARKGAPITTPVPAGEAYSSQLWVDDDDHWTDSKSFVVR